MPESAPAATTADALVPITLWAPLATRADALVDGVRLPMTPLPDSGSFTIELPVGTDYLLSIDGGPGYPDPRSPRQPAGVHGPSRVYDATRFAWTDQAWPGLDFRGHVFYELHVGTFTAEGTLDAAIGRLPHLKRTGVDIVELMPLSPFPGDRGWGYDGVSLFAVHEAYGGPEALQRFVDAAHRAGLAVCLDVVYNHFGPVGNYAPAFAPHHTERHHTPWGAAINLDDAHAEGVREFIIDNACRWLRDFHVDMLRLDAVHALADDSPTHHLLAELSVRVDELAAGLGRPCALIAESDLNQPAIVTPRDRGGLGLDGQWNDDLHHALHAYLTGETFGYYRDFGTPETLAHAFTAVFVHDGGYSTFRGRHWGAPVPDWIDRRRFVVFNQNHDQVGNRGLGDRPDATIAPGVVAASAALVLLGPFSPLLFQGQEWGTRRPFGFFTDHEPELGRAVIEGRAREFAQHGWEAIYGPDAVIPNPQARATFEASTLDWSELDQPDHRAVWEWFRDLIVLRRRYLADGGHRVEPSFGEGWFRLAHGPLTVLVAPTTSGASVTESRATIAAAWGGVRVANGTVMLNPQSVVVLRD